MAEPSLPAVVATQRAVASGSAPGDDRSGRRPPRRAPLETSRDAPREADSDSFDASGRALDDPAERVRRLLERSSTQRDLHQLAVGTSAPGASPASLERTALAVTDRTAPAPAKVQTGGAYATHPPAETRLRRSV